MSLLSDLKKAVQSFINRRQVENLLRTVQRVEAENPLNRQDRYRTAKAKVYRVDGAFRISLIGEGCGADVNTKAQGTLEEAVRLAVREADRENVRVTSWVKKY